jgi:uncharacterized protein YdeI (YjbR/CyaY-like superfamily)
VWLVFAKKRTKIPSLSYEDAVEEALCFGWIDSIMKSIDDRFHMQRFTPRKPKSAWSAPNRARVARLVKAGLMATAGLAAVAVARKAGTWKARSESESLTVPPELQRAIDANADARRNWPAYSESARKGFLYRVADAKRPDTREKRIQEVVAIVARKVSMTELRKAAMSGTSRELLASIGLTTSGASAAATRAPAPPRPARRARPSRAPRGSS